MRKLTALGYALFAGQADHAVMNLGGDGRTEQGKAAAEDSELGGNVGIEVADGLVRAKRETWRDSARAMLQARAAYGAALQTGEFL